MGHEEEQVRGQGKGHSKEQNRVEGRSRSRTEWMAWQGANSMGGTGQHRKES